MSIIAPPVEGVTTPPADVPLFEGYDPPPTVEAVPISADRRRTQRQAEQIAAGFHPLTGGILHPLSSRHRDACAPKADPFTCGSCAFRQIENYRDRSYAKCWLPTPGVGADAPSTQVYRRVTHGAASDVRAWWPACPDYSPGDRMSPDAARYIPGDDA